MRNVLKKTNLIAGVVALACALTALPMTTAFAHGGGGQGGSHMNSQGSANTNGPNSSDRDFGRDRAEDRTSVHSLDGSTAISANGSFGGHSGSHISSQGRLNSNGPNAINRQHGRHRAQLRRNAHAHSHGLTH